MLKIRRAEELDRQAIAENILASFKHDFSFFVGCFGRRFVLDFLKEILVIRRFYVADLKGNIIGLLAYSDSDGRATYLERKVLSRKFGAIRVFLLGFVLRDFEKQLALDNQTAYIEYVAVDPAYRRQGIASQLLEESMDKTSYKAYLLEVKDTNLSAIRCYQALDFKEKKRNERKNRFFSIQGF